MSGEDIFWLRLWQSILVAGLLAIGTIAGCDMHADRMIVDQVRAGANPIEAKCAIRTANMNSPDCVMRAMVRSE